MKNFRNSCVLAAAVFSFVAAAPALASGPLNLNPNDPDNIERWPAGGANIPWNPDQGGIAGVMDAATVAAAFDEWQNVATATATYSNNGTLAADVTAANFAPFIQNLFFGTNTSDGLSPIVFDDDGSIFVALFGSSGVLGFASPDTRDVNGTPIEAVCFLNGGATVSGGGGFPDADFFGVQVHEFGHYSGMAHTVVNGQSVAFGDASGPTPFDTYGPSPGNQVETMYPFAIVGGGEDTLHADDIAFYSTMYPAAGFFANSGTISGSVFAPNGSTPLTGVNVIARNVADPFVDAVSAISGDRGVAGAYTINGLTPGASYTVHIDQILAGGFSTPPLAIPGPEEFYNGAAESNNATSPDDPSDSVSVASVAGSPTGGIDIIVNSFAPGDALPVGDDGSVELFLPFTYEICGQEFDSVFVNANGNLTFGSGDSDFTETAGEMLSDQPRIAALWDDLSPFNLITGAQQGLVTFDESKNDFTVIFEDVPEFLTTGSNSFEITLKRSSNHIDIEYGDVSAEDGLAGVSCGGAVTSRFEVAEDLSAAAPSRLNLHNAPARYEVFGFGNANDSSNSTVRFNGTTDYNDNWAEPNNSLKQARNVSLPFDSIPIPRYTEIEPAGGDVDYYRFSAEENTTLVLEILTGQLDTVMGLYDSAGNLIAVDDDGGSGLLSRLVVPISASGKYYVAVSTFPDFDFDGDGNTSPTFGQGRYVLDMFAIDGILLDLGDDDSEEVMLGFSFPFQGGSYTSVFVNSNGNLTFGSGDTEWNESVGGFLADQPRIAALWDDLSPQNGGLVVADGDASSMTVSFTDVPEFIATGANNFSVTMHSDGSVDIAYGSVTASDGLVGITPGGSMPGGPGAVDLSAGGPYTKAGSTYEQFTFGSPFDLAGSGVTFDQ